MSYGSHTIGRYWVGASNYYVNTTNAITNIDDVNHEFDTSSTGIYSTKQL